MRPDATRSPRVASFAHEREYGQLNILVNNAGVTEGVKFADMTFESWSRVQRINVDGAMRLMQLAIAGMATRGSGQIINITSIAGKAGLRYSAAYTASKHALLGLTRSVALDYAARGVTLNCVCPGWVQTEMIETTLQNIQEKLGARGKKPRIVSSKTCQWHG